MPRKKKTDNPVINFDILNIQLENISDCVQSLEQKINHVNHIVSMTKYILDRQYENKLMNYDAYTWLHGNLRLIEDQCLADELLFINNAVEVIREQFAISDNYESLGLGKEIILDDNDLPF